MLNKIKWLLLKRQAKKEDYPILEVNQNAIDKFKSDVKGNSNCSNSLAILKIVRNYYCGQKATRFDTVTSAYGCLHIELDKKMNIIINIKNHREYGCNSGEIDKVLKEKLNKLYKIKEEK